VATTTAPTANVGFSPLDEALELVEKHWSPETVGLIVWLSGLMPYRQVTEVLSRVGRLHVSESSVWRLAQRWGKRMTAVLEAEEAEVKAAAREWSTPGGRETTPEQMGLAVDGAMMCLREEGWKEFRVGCVFDVAQESPSTSESNVESVLGHAVHISYRAQLSSAEAFGWPMWTEAHRRNWHKARDTLVLGDGATWIWKLRDDHFPGSEMLVDWYHATEHLGQAKQLRCPEGGADSSRWHNALELALYQGHADRVARSIERAAQEASDEATATALEKEAQYFRNNQRRMQYQDCRNAGWPIGSGMVESGAKQLKGRVAGPGMRWSRRGANNILTICATVRTGQQRFSSVWASALANSPDS